MSGLRKSVLDVLWYIGDHSGCHQIPERCLIIDGYRLPVCARCTGAGIGHITAIITLIAGLRVGVWVCFALLAVMGLDWGIQALGWKESTNTRRLISGICGGFGLFHFYFDCVLFLMGRWMIF